MASAGDIVTRLQMDSKGFVSGAARGQSAMTALTGTIVGGSRAIMASLAPIGAMFAGILTTRAALTAAREAIMGEQKLAAVLNASGHAAGMSAAAIGDYAEQRAQLTNFDDDATIGAASVLATMGNISGSIFTDTLTAAQDLSTVLGTDLSAASLQLGKALNDPATGLSRLTRMGIVFTESQQEQIRVMSEAGDLAGAQSLILDELQTKFGGAAEAVADPWIQLKNTLGEVSENMGHVLLPSINLVSASLNEMLGGVAGNAAAFRMTGQIAASAFKQISTAAELGWTVVQLGAVKSFGVVEHFFTQQAPAAFDWFGKNAGTIFSNLGTYTETVFANMAANIQNVFQETWDFISSAGTNAIKLNLRDLEAGYRAQAIEMLDLPERIKSELETQLEATAGSLAAELAAGLAFDISQPLLDEMMSGQRFAQDMMANLQDDVDAALDAPGRSQGRAESSAGALEARTAAAVSTVVRATNDSRSRADRIQDQQLAVQRDMAESLETIASRPQLQLAVARI